MSCRDYIIKLAPMSYMLCSLFILNIFSDNWYVMSASIAKAFEGNTDSKATQHKYCKPFSMPRQNIIYVCFVYIYIRINRDFLMINYYLIFKVY